MCKVLMVGPDRSLKGGIVSVVDALLASGLGDMCHIDYLGTGTGKNTLKKCCSFVKSLLRYCLIVSSYDVVHLHISAKGSFWRKAIMCQIAKGVGCKTILHEHSGEFEVDYEASPNWKKELIKRVFQDADKVIALSQTWTDYFERKMGCVDVETVANGTVLHELVFNPAKYGRILYLGRLDENKNPSLLIKSLGKLKELGITTSCVFAGDGDILRYEKLAAELGVSDLCHFVGWVDGLEKTNHIKRSSLLCMTSRCEGFPMSILECMSYGLPVVATAVGGIVDLVSNGSTGLLVKDDCVEDLVGALACLLSNPDRLNEMGRSAHDVIEDKYTVQRSRDRLIEIYKSLICKPSCN